MHSHNLLNHKKMKKVPIKQKLTSLIFSKIPFSILSKLTQTNLILPYYHMVSNEEVLHVKYLYGYKKVKQFKDDLDFLLKNYLPISLHDLIDILKTGRTFPEKTFLLTFDDGFREMYDIVAPILLKKGVPATFFINSDFTDNKKLCYQHKASILVEHFQKMVSVSLKEKVEDKFLKSNIKCKDIRAGILSINYQEKDIVDEIAQLVNVDFDSYLLKEKPYLTSDQIRGLINDGFTIGAHSIDHPLYSSLSFEEQLCQTSESTRFIKERFCLNYSVFAFPHTDNNVSKRFFEEIYKSGLIDVSFGTGGMINDIFSNNIQRFSLEKPLMPAEKILGLHFARKLYRILKRNDKLKRVEVK